MNFSNKFGITGSYLSVYPNPRHEDGDDGSELMVILGGKGSKSWCLLYLDTGYV